VALTATDVARQVRKRFGDPGGVIIKDQDIFDWINDAQLQIFRQTESLITTQILADANAIPYMLPSNMIAIQKVFYNVPAVNIGGSPLVFTTEEDLLAKNLDISYQGTPEFWYAPNNGQILYTYPLPLSTDVSTVSIYYTRTPAVIASIGTALDVKESYQQDVVTFCLIRAHEVNENWVAADQLRSEFLSGVSQNRHESFSADDGFSVVRDDPWDMDPYYMVGW
jgi:hypothetical protein